MWVPLPASQAHAWCWKQGAGRALQGAFTGGGLLVARGAVLHESAREFACGAAQMQCGMGKRRWQTLGGKKCWQAVQLACPNNGGLQARVLHASHCSATGDGPGFESWTCTRARQAHAAQPHVHARTKLRQLGAMACVGWRVAATAQAPHTGAAAVLGQIPAGVRWGGSVSPRIRLRRVSALAAEAASV